jgi:hypothetical protein
VSGSQVRWNGTAIATTFSTESSLSATVPKADLADGGMAAITVFNPAPGGGTSAVANFTINNPPPVIATVDSASVVAGSAAQTLDLTGTGFVPSSTVEWSGAALATLWVSATELKATLPASAIGGSSAATAVTVQNPAPGGGTSAPTPFTVTSPRPVLTSISPQIVPAGQAPIGGSGSITFGTLRFYRLTPEGRKRLKAELSEYDRMTQAIQAILRTA